ncbi:MAG: polysaccharide biosynthesis C-terminal domain-containing protein [Solirubrobacteraceae bacterium]
MTSATGGVAPPERDALDHPSAGSRAIRGSALRGMGYAVGTLLTLASAPLLVRHLGLVESGRYFTVVALVALVGGVSDAGLAVIAVREYAVRTGPERDRFMREILGARLGLTVAGVLAATTFAALAGYGGALILGTVLAGLGLVLATLTHTYAIPLFANLRVGWQTAIDVLAKALGAGLVIAFVLASAGTVVFLAVPILPGVVSLVLIVALTRGEVPLRPSTDWRELGRLLRETLPIAVATVLATLYARVVILVMSIIATKVATGQFGTASRVGEVAVGVPVALVGTTFPIFARAASTDPARFAYVLRRVGEVALIGGAWMTLVTLLGAGVIADVLVPARDGPAGVAEVLRIISVALLLVFLNVTWQTGLVALGRLRDLAVVNGTALAALVVLTFVLVPSLAARGAAIAAVGGEAVLMTGSVVALWRARPDLRLELGLLPRVAAAFAGAVAVATILPGAGAVDVIAATVAYFGILATLGGIPGELRQALARREPGRVLGS